MTDSDGGLRLLLPQSQTGARRDRDSSTTPTNLGAGLNLSLPPRTPGSPDAGWLRSGRIRAVWPRALNPAPDARSARSSPPGFARAGGRSSACSRRAPAPATRRSITQIVDAACHQDRRASGYAARGVVDWSDVCPTCAPRSPTDCPPACRSPAATDLRIAETQHLGARLRLWQPELFDVQIDILANAMGGCFSSRGPRRRPKCSAGSVSGWEYAKPLLERRAKYCGVSWNGVCCLNLTMRVSTAAAPSTLSKTRHSPSWPSRPSS